MVSRCLHQCASVLSSILSVYKWRKFMNFIPQPSSKSPFNRIMMNFPMRKAAASYLEGRKRGFSNRLAVDACSPHTVKHDIKNVDFEYSKRFQSMCDTQLCSMRL